MKTGLTITIGENRLVTGLLLAKLLGVKGGLITRLADRDGLPFVRVGRQRLYEVQEVADWLDKHNGRETPLAAALRNFRYEV